MSWNDYKAGDLPGLERCGGAAVAAALTWLDARHGAAVAAAIDAMLFEGLRAAERQKLADLDAATRLAIRNNATEWLLAEGRIEVAGVQQAVAACLLGADGPPLAAAERRWIEQMARRPVRLYEVADVLPDGRIALFDLLDAASAPCVVAADALAAPLPPGSRVGLRLLELDGQATPSGAVYAFAAAGGDSVAAQLREAAEQFRGRDDLAHFQGVLIRYCWLAQCHAAGAARRTCGCGHGKSGRPGAHALAGDEIEQALAAALAPKQ